MDLDLNEVYIIDPKDMNVVIQAESTNQDYTSGLSRTIHLEVQKRKKQLSQLDQKKLGKFSELFGLYKLLHEIQSNIIKSRPKLKPIKLELPLMLQNIEKNLSPIAITLDDPNIEALHDNKKNNLSFGSIEVIRKWEKFDNYFEQISSINNIVVTSDEFMNAFKGIPGLCKKKHSL